MPGVIGRVSTPFKKAFSRDWRYSPADGHLIHFTRKMTTIRNITQHLRPPAVVAQSLDWRKESGTILNLTIRKHSVQGAIATHPTSAYAPLLLDQIPLNTHSTAEQLAAITRDYAVCGLIVSWPLQAEGRCGHACGHVLHILDQWSTHPTLITNKPLCLWDEQHAVSGEDE